ncbi:MAG: hypothetical protein FWG27_01975 [Treponema sp.]|nr:hypothetical protein [Treponema sp.]
MKPSIRYLILAGLIVPFIMISCKSTRGGDTASLTDTVIQQDLDNPADEISLEELAKARAKAEESRDLAEYVDGNIYCPGEWDLAESRYNAARNQRGDPETKGEAYARTAEWKAIGALYDGIYGKSAPQFAGEQDKKLAAAREDAVRAGAGELVPDRLALADAKAASSRQKFERNDINGSISEGKDAWDRYRILQTLAEARTKQAEADELKFFTLDPDNYMIAAEAGNKAVSDYDKGNLAEAKREADESLSRFTQVIRNGWTSMVEEKASVAREQRAASQEAKADVAVRSDFAAAEQVYNQAHVALRGEAYTQAMDLFEQSGELYIIARDNALEKRKIAEEALRRTEQKLAESEELGKYADEIIGGEE